MAETAVRVVALPEHLAHLDPASMDAKAKAKAVKVYEAKTKAQFEKRLKARVERFEKGLGEKAESPKAQVLLRKILIEGLNAEIGDRRDARSALHVEIKKIRASGRRKKADTK